MKKLVILCALLVTTFSFCTAFSWYDNEQDSWPNHHTQEQPVQDLIIQHDTSNFTALEQETYATITHVQSIARTLKLTLGSQTIKKTLETQVKKRKADRERARRKAEQQKRSQRSSWFW
ncbi:hypothetical protein K2W90_03805 [Candidatus Babeliales bacterium]|nr:hypothetical protein [Candidatus Babeliales bacterium]